MGVLGWSVVWVGWVGLVTGRSAVIRQGRERGNRVGGERGGRRERRVERRLKTCLLFMKRFRHVHCLENANMRVTKKVWAK